MTTTHTSVVHDLGALAHRLAHPAGPPCGCEPPRILADRPDGTVVRSGAVVAKAHAADTDREALAARIALAAAPALAGILLPPLTAPEHVECAERDGRPATPHLGVAAPYGSTTAPDGGVATSGGSPAASDAGLVAPRVGVATPAGSPGAPGGRPVSLWPLGTPVDPTDPGAAPWAEAAELLAGLHRTAPPFPLPPMRGPAKAARAVARMSAARPGDPALLPVLAGWRTLPAWARDEAAPPALRSGFLCHGDLHLGQLVRHPVPDGPWLLIDVDDAGVGDPAWDLARPAAWYAAGLLAPEDWSVFLHAYRSAGGPAVPADGDPWPVLDVPARALTVQTAAVALAKCAAQQRDPDAHEQLMIESCARIATLPPELTPGPAS
ncbi:phosphotransferase enzyme family protein [Streptomyces californicus]|uniref:phosphotransferase enzyme family protein n=1 Tax=Streptomyces californicus TaxID=67351 RepID=UPI001E52699E|nr:aminoglycoside phosphotransferase family protein [Streptomyces californicus]MCC0578877.1 phosphotransferase [Streptomyces californicus]